jgi:hypothetical protein
MGRAAENPQDPTTPDLIPGEFGELLARIEKEAVPARLLELAVQLQTALRTTSKSRQDQRALVDS